MARIMVWSREDFERALASLARPVTHVIVTDEASSIVAVPRVSSRHRHYIAYTGGQGEVAELVSLARKLGYEVYTGIVQVMAEG